MAEVLKLDAKLNIILHANQQKIEDSTARFKVIKAGKRFGKSKWACYAILRKAGLKPYGTFWYIAPTYSQAKKIAWPIMRNILPSSWVKQWHETDLKVTLQNNAQVFLIGADNEDNLRGPELNGMVLDERAYQKEDIWNNILRGQITRSLGFAYFISSPSKTGRNHYTNFCEMAKNKMLSGDPEWAYFYYTINDNPTLTTEEVEKLHNECPEYVWNLEYLAQESDMAGQKYSEFNFDANVGEYSGNKTLSLYRGLDWGLDHPTVCLWGGLDLEEKVLYITDEYVKSGLTIREHCQVIKDKTGDRNVEWSVIDPSASRRDPMTKRSLQDEFARWGVTCIGGDRRERGTDILKMFLKRGMIKIAPRCKTLIYELQNLQWGDTEGDDASDALRYMCVRINDLVYGMNIKDSDTKPFERNENPNILNFNDPLIFPDKNKEKQTNSWVFSELEEVA